MFDIDERTLGRLTAASPDWLQKAACRSWSPGRGTRTIYRSQLDSIDPQVDPHTGTARCRAPLPNADGALVPGMFVRVRMITGAPHKVLLIADRAIGSNQGEKFVFVVTEHNVVEERTVKIGQFEDGLRVVTELLTAEDWVVVSGLQRLAPGMQVIPDKTSVRRRRPRLRRMSLRLNQYRPRRRLWCGSAAGGWTMVGRLPSGETVELVAIGEGNRWWQPNGAPLATPPGKLVPTGPDLPAEPNYVRRTFLARVGNVPLPGTSLASSSSRVGARPAG